MDRRAFTSLTNWIDEGSTGTWSPTHPSDAQRESFLVLIAAFVFIFVFWHGRLPYWIYREDDRWRFKTFPFPILLPFKLLTVLYHELSHAVVGMLTIWWKEMRHGVKKERGKIDYIYVDKYEGGFTQFGNGTQPNYRLALPAGYIGSCVVGSWFIFTGFDAKWSKFGALSLLAITTLATIVCIFIRAKSGFIHHRHVIYAWLCRWVLCSKDRAERMEKQRDKDRAEWEAMDEEDLSRHDKHVSQDLIILCSLLVGVILFVAWEWDDSIYLRFVMLCMGLLSACYAVWDIVLDGIKNADIAQSDATLMYMEHKRRVEKRHAKASKGDPHAKRKQIRGTKFYATMWLFTKLVIIILVIIAAYFTFRLTVTEQAIESREFMPAKYHYGPAELSADTDSAEQRVEGWIGQDGDL